MYDQYIFFYFIVLLLLLVVELFRALQGILKNHFVRMESGESTRNIRMKAKVPEIFGFARKVQGTFELAAKVRGTRR